jgi:hypothetical protein
MPFLLPTRLVEELQGELKQNGLDADVCHESNKGVAILTRVEAGAATPWSASGLAKGIKDVLERCAVDMDQTTPSSCARPARIGSGIPRVTCAQRPAGRQGCADPGGAEQPGTRLDRDHVRIPDDRTGRTLRSVSLPWFFISSPSRRLESAPPVELELSLVHLVL